MKSIVRDAAAKGCKASTGLLGTGNNNTLLIIIIVIVLCGCFGQGDILGSQGRRRRKRGRSRGGSGSRLWPIFILLALLGNNGGGRNANTNIINVDTAAEDDYLDI
jgi:hypothetical protein